MHIMQPRCTTHIKLSNVTCGMNSWLECHACNAKLYRRSKDKLINNEDMYDRLCASEKEIKSLKMQVKFLSEKLDEIYYAPGMPGFISVKNDFESVQIKEQTIKE